MTYQTPTVTAALLADSVVTGIIGTNLFSDSPPDEACFSVNQACLTYEEHLAPAQSADDDEATTAVQFNMEAHVRENAWPLAMAVQAVMKSLGYGCVFMKSAGMTGVVHQISLQFTTVKEV